MEIVKITYIGSNYPVDRIKPIKALRGLMGIGIKEAKEALEEAYANTGIPIELPSAIYINGMTDVRIMESLNVLEGLSIITSINSPINDLRIQLVDLIKEATDAECFGLAGDIASVCDKYFGLSTAYIRGDKP